MSATDPPLFPRGGWGPGDATLARRVMPSEEVGSFRRSFRPEFSSAAVARRDLEALCAHVDDDLLDRSSLALTEVLTNSVKHAQLKASQLIDVQVALLAALLRIEVTDDGIGFHRDSAAGGWGLCLLDQLTDRWGVDGSHSTRVWLEFDRGPS